MVKLNERKVAVVGCGFVGSGTVLDTARFKYLLGEHLSVDSRSVHAFIIGEQSKLYIFADVAVGMALDGIGDKISEILAS